MEKLLAGLQVKSGGKKRRKKKEYIPSGHDSENINFTLATGLANVSLEQEVGKVRAMMIMRLLMRKWWKRKLHLTENTMNRI